MNKRHYEHTLPNIRGSLSNTYFSPIYSPAVYAILSGDSVMTGNLCNPVLPSRFDRTITGSPEFSSGVVHADIVPLVFLHPRNRRQFSMSFRRLPFAGLPLVYGRSVSTVSGQFSFVFIQLLFTNFNKSGRFVTGI